MVGLAFARRDVAGTLSLHVPRSGARTARDTEIDIRFAAVELTPPKRVKGAAPVRVWAVYALERKERVPAGLPLE